MWKLNDEISVPVKCQVERYSLSAHADSKELLALVQKVQPRKLFPVHGDEGARKELEKSIQEELPSVSVILPKNREVHRIGKWKGIAGGKQWWNDRIVSEVAASIRKMGLEGHFAYKSWRRYGRHRNYHTDSSEVL